MYPAIARSKAQALILKTAKSGGARRDRTADLLRARQALSQLSYGPFLLVFFAPGCVALVVRSVTYISTLPLSLLRAPCLTRKILRKNNLEKQGNYFLRRIEKISAKSPDIKGGQFFRRLDDFERVAC